MRLEALLKGVDFDTVCGTLDKEAGTLIYHSDKSNPDAVFFAIRGEKTDGHQFTEKAAEKGVICPLSSRQVKYLKISLLNCRADYLCMAAFSYATHFSLYF